MHYDRDYCFFEFNQPIETNHYRFSQELYQLLNSYLAMGYKIRHDHIVDQFNNYKSTVDFDLVYGDGHYRTICIPKTMIAIKRTPQLQPNVWYDVLQFDGNPYRYNVITKTDYTDVQVRMYDTTDRTHLLFNGATHFAYVDRNLNPNVGGYYNQPSMCAPIFPMCPSQQYNYVQPPINQHMTNDQCQYEYTKVETTKVKSRKGSVTTCCNPVVPAPQYRYYNPAGFGCSIDQLDPFVVQQFKSMHLM